MLEVNKIYNMDCLEGMKQLDDNSIDAIVSDPPAGISFMGKTWDTFDKTQFGIKGQEGKNDLKVKKNFEVLPRYGDYDLLGFQEFIYKTFLEVYRVLKPGAHGLIWAIPRTSHHTAMGLERAGFEIRDVITHLFFTGFPKSYNIGKGMKKKGFEIKEKDYYDKLGTALKPASEHWILIRKPLSEKNIVDNVLKWGTGGINIDDCRIPINKEKETDSRVGTDIKRGYKKGINSTSLYGNEVTKEGVQMYKEGRFPANVILDEEAGKMLDKQSENNTSRFFYCPKPSKREREKGLDDFIEKISGGMKGTEDKSLLTGSGNERNNLRKNIHPTVKSIKLMQYLVRLVTPKNGIVLDPFIGSGTTAIACYKENKQFIGFEKEKEYFDIAEARIKYWTKQKRLM